MIILEVLVWILKNWIIAGPVRFIIWLITGRDCRRCKSGRVLRSPYGYEFTCTDCELMKKCQRFPWRSKFKRRAVKL